jgi:hypothetical protein
MKEPVITSSLLLVLACTDWVYPQTTRSWNTHSLNDNPGHKTISGQKFLNPRPALQEKPENEFIPLNKCVSIFAGIAFGSVLGALAGAAIGDGDIEDGARGALIGASVFPFINYEYSARKYRVIQGTKGLGMKSGNNFASSNHENCTCAGGKRL